MTWRRAALILCIAAGCTSTTHLLPARTTSSNSPSSSPRSPALSSCPAPRHFRDLPVFARDLGAPDDLLVAADGSLWVTDPNAGTIRHLSATGRLLDLIRDLETPEGMVGLPDGTLFVAEQRRNRIVEIHPPRAARRVVLQLPAAGSAEGLDGINLDAAHDEILVPDSPHGRLYAWPVGGGRARLLAQDLGRAVDALVGPDGKVYVTSEAVPGLLRIENGRGVAINAIVQADDIVAVGSLLYVTLIGSGKLIAVDPSTGEHRDLVDGIGAAQGLAVMRDGRLAIADSNDGTVGLTGACR